MEDQQGQTGVTEPMGAAGQAPSTEPTQPQQPATPSIPQDLEGVAVPGKDGKVMVPLDALQSERTKRQDYENRIKKLEEQVWLYQMNPVQGPGGQQPSQQQNQPQGQPPTPQQPQGPSLPDFLEKMDDNEMINAGELKNALKNLSLPQAASMQSMDDRAMEMAGEQILSMMKPDTEQVLMGGLRQRLQSEPYLVNYIKNAPPLLRPFIAYRLGQGQTQAQAEMGAQADLNQQQRTNVGQAIQNAQKPTATSAVSAGGGFNEADRLLSMSDEEFQAEISRVKGY